MKSLFPLSGTSPHLALLGNVSNSQAPPWSIDEVVGEPVGETVGSGVGRVGETVGDKVGATVGMHGICLA